MSMRTFVEHVKMYYQKGRYNLRQINWMLQDGKITDEEYRYIVGEN